MSPRVPSEPWRREFAEVVAELGTDVERGLTSDEVAERLALCGPNELEAEPEVPVWRKILRQFADPLIYLRRWQSGETSEALCVHRNKCMPTIYRGTHCVLVSADQRPGVRLLRRDRQGRQAPPLATAVNGVDLTPFHP